MAHWLGTFTALAEDQGQGPSINIRTLTTTCNFSSRGPGLFFWFLQASACIWHIDSAQAHTDVQHQKNNVFLNEITKLSTEKTQIFTVQIMSQRSSFKEDFLSLLMSNLSTNKKRTTLEIQVKTVQGTHKTLHLCRSNKHMRMVAQSSFLSYKVMKNHP